MPTRMIRDGILTSERVNALSERAEIFYRRLLSVVDDYGRFSANLSLLRASCYPLKLDGVKEDSIKKHLAEAEGAGLVVLYTVDAKQFLEVQDFGQRVQSKSKFPDPTGQPQKSTVDHGDSPEKTALVVVVVEDEVVVGTPPRKRGKPAKLPLPEDFSVSARVEAWAKGKGFEHLPAHLENFRSKAKANGYAYADWDEAFMTAIRDDWAKLRLVAPNSGASRKRVDL